ncbi:hypothetical protein SUGI_0225980 [Cryptomeria japonica]|uniref:histone H1 n=1 Tax=Cryptomeria japonica TaxID=3369 RepID=UPI002408C707|nr:histone H1 [Cryptomeria japonica]GLJ14099.1 hypothetical protein SUGI_0225980 [Cryptomeria japonica]
MVSAEGGVSVKSMATEKKSKEAQKVKVTPSHPPYRKMIMEAISELKERNGSSQQAITKFIEEKYKSHLQPSFKKVLLTQLKNLTKAEELTRVKNSFKLKAKAAAKVSRKPQRKKIVKNAGVGKVGKAGKADKKKKAVKSPKKVRTPRKTPKTIRSAKPAVQKK